MINFCLYKLCLLKLGYDTGLLGWEFHFLWLRYSVNGRAVCVLYAFRSAMGLSYLTGDFSIVVAGQRDLFTLTYFSKGAQRLRSPITF